jgi:hypothetical protein
VLRPDVRQDAVFSIRALVELDDSLLSASTMPRKGGDDHWPALIGMRGDRNASKFNAAVDQELHHRKAIRINPDGVRAMAVRVFGLRDKG